MRKEKKKKLITDFTQAYGTLPDGIVDLERHPGTKESTPVRVRRAERITVSDSPPSTFLCKQKSLKKSWPKKPQRNYNSLRTIKAINSTRAPTTSRKCYLSARYAATVTFFMRCTDRYFLSSTSHYQLRWNVTETAKWAISLYNEFCYGTGSF